MVVHLFGVFLLSTRAGSPREVAAGDFRKASNQTKTRAAARGTSAALPSALATEVFAGEVIGQCVIAVAGEPLLRGLPDHQLYEPLSPTVDA